MASRTRSLGARLALLTLSTVVCIIALEGLLRALTYFPIHPKDANRRDHPVLGYVMSSELSDIDAEGFRNPEPLGDVDLVAIGDSHTYGFNVLSAESWPAQLAERKQISVYNYGMGGYGILQYRWLFPKALGKNPRMVVVALYLANDLGDYCSFSQTAHWERELRERDLGNEPCPAARNRERAPIGSESDTLRNRWVATAIGSAFDYLLWRGVELRANPDAFVPASYGSHATFLPKRLVERHGRYTDLQERAVADAARGTEVLLTEMIKLARAANVTLGVLFIPSKENVLLEATDPLEPFYADLKRVVLQERAIELRFDRYLSARGVATAHALACLQTRGDVRLYTQDDNHHPIRAGYACYAEAAMELLEDETGSIVADSTPLE